MRVSRTLAVILTTSATLAVAVPGTALADSGSTTTNEVASALDNVDTRTGLVLDAAQSSAVSVPNDPNRGVQVTLRNGQKMSVGLPNAARSGKAAKTRKGAVAYAGKNGSANAVIPTADGVQLLTTIENRKAPTSFAYPITLPQGGKVGLAVQGGGAAVYDAKGNLSAIVTTPWAKDANGKDVRTWFTTDGKTLTQHVEHRASGVKYPVVADPSVRWYWNGAVVTLNRGDMAAVMYGGSQALIPMLMIPGVGWVAIASVLGMSAYAAWAYHNRQCAWFWLSVPSNWGWYAC